MREIRLSGSEGGGFECNRFSLPLSSTFSLPYRQGSRLVVMAGRSVMIYRRIGILPPRSNIRRRPRGAKWQRFTIRFELWPFCRFC